jgi:acetyltransferase-like isoleucine patch superfamily enzyme
MPAKEVLDFYHLKGPFGILRYGFKFVWRFFLDKVAFFCFVKSWRTMIHRWRGVKIGKGVYIGHEVMFDRVFTDQISIGDNTSIGDRTIITAHANIPSNTRLKKIYPRKVMPTKIGSGVWIMPAVIIAPGVTIGDESVIATGSVVTKDVPPRCLVAGVPAKVVKDLSDHEAFKEELSR